MLCTVPNCGVGGRVGMNMKRSGRIALFAAAVLSAGYLLFVALRQPASGPWVVPPEAALRVNPEPDTVTVRAAGSELYREHCMRCHGESGRGDGPEAMQDSVRMPDFTDPVRMAERSDGELFYKISVGRRPMPGYRRRLTESQRWQLVRFLRTLAAVPTQPAEPRP